MLVGVRIPKTLSTRWFSGLNIAASRRFPELRTATVSVAFVSPQEMKRLNLLYRGKPKPTDVLSFRYAPRKRRATAGKRQFFDVPETQFGEILLCLPVLTAQAKTAGHTVEQEFQSLVIHGLLHLLGHDHGNNRDEQRMNRMEQALAKDLVSRRRQ